MTKTSQRWNDLICLCLAFVTLAVYWPVRHFQFVNYDDMICIVQNPHVRGGLTTENLVWAITRSYSANWYPLTWISHMLNCQLFGLDAGAHHLVNVFIHVASTLLLFHVLNRMTASPWRSAFVAALFALHPLHVESVAWVTERSDVLSAFFWMLTLWAYVRYVEKFTVFSSQLEVQQTSPLSAPRSPLSPFYALTLVFFTLGLMAKPMLVTLPFVLLLLDYWPLGRTRWAKAAANVTPSSGGPRGACAERGRSIVAAGIDTPAAVVTETDPPNSVILGSFGRLLAEKLPFFVLSAASCVVTLWAQRGSISPFDNLPLTARLSNAAVSYVAYLAKAVWPVHLAVFYPYAKLPASETVLAVVVLVGISVWTICRVRRAPQFIVGWLWYLGTLAPVIGLVQVGGQALADRYTYLPLVGVFMMLAWAAPDRVLERRAIEATDKTGSCCHAAPPAWGDRAPRLQQITAATAIALLCVLAVLCRLQVRYWQNTETLFRHALRVTKDNWIAHYNLGFTLAQSGRIPESLGHFEEAVRIKPEYLDAQYNLGLALTLQGRASEAVASWEQALRIEPRDTKTQNSLARVLAMLPRSEGGNPARAVSLARQACQLNHNRVSQDLDTLAIAYASAGQFDDAITTGQKALELARSTGRWQMAGELEGRLEMYRSGRAPTVR